MSFCPYCGTKQEKPKVFCGYCGAEMDLDAIYCNNCGKKSYFIQQKENEEARKRVAEAKAKAEKERQARIKEKERKAKEAAEKERRRLQEKLKAEKKAEKARKEAERKAHEEAERVRKEKEEAKRKAIKTIDLGLPSGTKWADENVEGFYSWGEVQDKEDEGYYVENYVHCDGDLNSMHRIGDNICGTQYDVAHVKWGGKWRMPTIEQFEELVANCSFEAEDGYNRIKVTSKINGNIFYIIYDGHAEEDDYFDSLILWAGNEDGPYDAKCLLIAMDADSEEIEISGERRYLGGTIRPVLTP